MPMMMNLANKIYRWVTMWGFEFIRENGKNIFFVAHRQKSTGFDLSIFYPLRKQWYIITRKRASHHRRCISSAAGCISFRNDDIQNFVLMICNSCGIDDIHGFRRDLCKSSNSYSIMPKISFLYPIDKNRQVSTETCRFYFFTINSSLFS